MSTRTAPQHVRLKISLKQNRYVGNIKDVRRLGRSLNLTDDIRADLGSKAEDGHRSLPDLINHHSCYLTNSEMSLLEEYSQAIARSIEPGSILLELGSGNLRKTGMLLQALKDAWVSVDYMRATLTTMSSPEQSATWKPIWRYVRCHGLWGTYEDGPAWTRQSQSSRKPLCILSLGSALASFTHSEASKFLRGWSEVLSEHSARSQILLGMDGTEDAAKVHSAYNDADGANKRFVLDALQNANSHLGYEAFRAQGWTSRVEWDAENQRHEQYLVPLRDMMVEG